VPKVDLENVFSLDVECIATGTSHKNSDREPCELALVDGSGTLVMHTLIKPSSKVVSYLTPFTGLKEGDLDGDDVVSLDEAIQELKRLLPKSAWLVGQGPLGDVEWMRLTKGEDYIDVVDFANVLQGRNGWPFSLRHNAKVLLGKTPKPGRHDPRWDAAVSVEIYWKLAKASPWDMLKMRTKLMSDEFWPPEPSLARQCGFEIDGVSLRPKQRR
jgi:DNA polymerase III epsilon subunit-like protein